MKVLFLVDGAAGTGKSDLVSYVSNTFRYTAIKINKYTTRKKRKSEEAKKSDLIFISSEEPDSAKLKSFRSLKNYRYYVFRSELVRLILSHPLGEVL